jgi:hypothetical protein
MVIINGEKMKEANEEISLVIKIETLERNKSGSIIGVIYFDFGDKKFPEIGWYDFVDIILSWWLESLKKILKNFSEKEELLFMDGPLQINLIKKNYEICLLKCIHIRKNEERLEHSQTANIANLLSTILRGAKDIIKICKEKNWSSNDVDILKELVNELEDVGWQ